MQSVWRYGSSLTFSRAVPLLVLSFSRIFNPWFLCWWSGPKHQLNYTFSCPLWSSWDSCRPNFIEDYSLIWWLVSSWLQDLRLRWRPQRWLPWPQSLDQFDNLILTDGWKWKWFSAEIYWAGKDKPGRGKKGWPSLILWVKYSQK